MSCDPIWWWYPIISPFPSVRLYYYHQLIPACLPPTGRYHLPTINHRPTRCRRCLPATARRHCARRLLHNCRPPSSPIHRSPLPSHRPGRQRCGCLFRQCGCHGLIRRRRGGWGLRAVCGTGRAFARLGQLNDGDGHLDQTLGFEHVRWAAQHVLEEKKGRVNFHIIKKTNSGCQNGGDNFCFSSFGFISQASLNSIQVNKI